MESPFVRMSCSRPAQILLVPFLAGDIPFCFKRNNHCLLFYHFFYGISFCVDWVVPGPRLHLVPLLASDFPCCNNRNHNCLPFYVLFFYGTFFCKIGLFQDRPSSIISRWFPILHNRNCNFLPFKTSKTGLREPNAERISVLLQTITLPSKWYFPPILNRSACVPSVCSYQNA